MWHWWGDWACWLLGLGSPRAILGGTCRRTSEYCFPCGIWAMCQARYELVSGLEHEQLAVVPPAPQSFPQYTKRYQMWLWWGSEAWSPPCFCTLGLATLLLIIVESWKSAGWAVLCMGSPPELQVNYPSHWPLWSFDYQSLTPAGVSGHCKTAPLSLLLARVHGSPDVLPSTASPLRFPRIILQGLYPG